MGKKKRERGSWKKGFRWFNGKKFFLEESIYAKVKPKSHAQKRAEELREKGFNVRVVPYKHGYDIYRRKRGR